MSKDIIQKSIKCLAKAKLETTYAVARDIVLDELINLQKIEKEHQKLNGELRKENEQLKELTKDKSYCENCEFKKDSEMYEEIIDKAIEYINKHPINACHYLLNILQGGDEDGM